MPRVGGQGINGVTAEWACTHIVDEHGVGAIGVATGVTLAEGTHFDVVKANGVEMVGHLASHSGVDLAIVVEPPSLLLRR